ncbi:MAG TPA: tRNA pseudouridine(55) synthase TruB [Cyclobacteriaceae bacterium]|jgi:tRNA pseudouridine55 synthase|nr:tRNA pseudouridine(55) synthase TruB [Cytophagales bacterium]HMR55912.1 tRNA pseudouridine(55) synthase TruB [Cyclobacteriaceae bacterium]HNT49877.1 tRNA pseudouridine(55) synthase TruB [Cyclobacteriaceae bacterium]HRE66931.1 tRNA pseudouridine(55) synthase TruB [Cyclobacteriaceae bacterium]HRF34200.1 tRNA pseudouridine(55) synthase TruB [Cyclobacteriaceae bacterium]
MSEYLDRVLLINKPLEWTSFDVVNKLRGKLKIKKIGHAGTLDPLATGLLILCTGKMTKRIDEYQAQEKEYTGTFVIGQTTPSHDLETDVSVPIEIDHLTDDIILRAAQKFTGTIQQIPPLHSAIKVGGKRAYALARKGEEVVLKPREVTISTFEITNITKPHIRFRIVCSKGTYIRSLARDFGNELGTGAYLAELCRTRIGEFKLADAQELDQINPEVK